MLWRVSSGWCQRGKGCRCLKRWARRGQSRNTNTERSYRVRKIRDGIFIPLDPRKIHYTHENRNGFFTHVATVCNCYQVYLRTAHRLLRQQDTTMQHAARDSNRMQRHKSTVSGRDPADHMMTDGPPVTELLLLLLVTTTTTTTTTTIN